MDEQTIKLAFQIINLKGSLKLLQSKVLEADICAADKARFQTSIVALNNLLFTKEAIAWSCDDYFASLADNFRGFEVKRNEDC